MSDPTQEQIEWALQWMKDHYGDDKYPGSNTERKNYDEPEPDKLWHLGEGRKYLVGGKQVEFYSIGQLAAALNRSPITVRRWERQGIIPVAKFVKPGTDGDVRGKRRLYSRAQVEGMVAAARETGILGDLGKAIRDTDFTARVIKIFQEIEGA